MRGLLLLFSFCSLLSGTALAGSLPIQPAQHSIFDGGQLPPAAQGIMTFEASGGLNLTALRYSALPLTAPIGTAFFCTDCANTGQPVFFNGSAWVDASGGEAKHS